MPSESQPPGPPQPSDAAAGLVGTSELLPRARAGDARARQELLERFTPVLASLLHARLPGRVRGLLDTDDLVQEVLARTLGRLESFE